MTPILPWSETFAIGHAGLDAEHRHLVDLINSVGANIQAKKSPPELVDLLRSLRKVAAEHFRHEDALLREIQAGTYPPWREKFQSAAFLKAIAGSALLEHIAEHQSLLSELDTVIAGPVNELCEKLKAWFVDHVTDYEASVKTLFQAAP